MKRSPLLEPGLDHVEVSRRVARVLPAFSGDRFFTVTHQQVHLMNTTLAVNDRADGIPRGLAEADILEVEESASTLQTVIANTAELGVAVWSHYSRYTGHAKLYGQYGSSSYFAEGIDVMRFGADAVTGVIVQPRRCVGDVFEPQINFRIRSDSDPMLSMRGEDGQFHDVPSPGRWYKFPLDAVLVAGMGDRDPSQQM